MNLLEVFRLYNESDPLQYEIKNTSHGEEDFRLAVFVEWTDTKNVIKIADNDFTTPERVAAWAKTVDAYCKAGYYCPRIIKNVNDQYAESTLIDNRNCIVYAEEFSKYKTAEAYDKSQIMQDGFYTFGDRVLETIGIIGAKHLNTADFPSGYCILEEFAPSDPCDEVMEESLHFKRVIDESLSQHKERFAAIWHLFLENKRKLEDVYSFLPTSVFQGDLNYTNILLDENKAFVGLLDFNLCGRDTILNYLFRQIMMECDCCGYDIFYSKKANEKTIELFLSKIKLVANTYSFSELEKNAALFVYRYLKPFWWRPAHEIENVKDDEQKVLMILEWVEHELTRTDIDFSKFMGT